MISIRYSRSAICRLASIVLAFSLMLEVIAADLPAVSQAMRLAGEGVAAAEANDVATYLAKMEEAVALRPDIPRLLSHLAAAQTAAERPDEAVATLERLAALGIVWPLADAEQFAPLRGRADFAEVVRKIAANDRPKGKGELAFTLRPMTGLIEGIAWREKTGAFYFGDVNGRAVWLRTKEGKLRRLTPEGDELLGVFGLAVDEANGALWAATTAVSAMRGYTPEMQGSAALAEIDLETGAIRRTLPVPPPERGEAMNLLGDLAIGPDGSIYLPDTGEPCLWRLAPGGDALERFLESQEFLSLQGMTILPSGVAVVSDRINGLLRVELGSGNVARFESPADVTLVGIDGVAVGRGNFVFAVQSGESPMRVLRIDFDPAAESVRSVTVLESAHFTMAAPTLGCLGPAGDFYFVGNGGWHHFDGGNEPTEPRPVPIFRTTAAAGGRR